MLKALKDFFFQRDWAIIFSVLIGLELILQLGFYKPFLKKNSYAANINLVTSKAIETKESLNPNVLVLGTSIAFEGISLPILNETLARKGIRVQTLAVRASELVVQHAILQKYLAEFPNVKQIVHIMEPGMPWVDRDTLTDPTLVMLSEVSPWQSNQFIYDFEYKSKVTDLLSVSLKTISYRKDFADFLLNTSDRIKYLSKRSKEEKTSWVHDNDTIESIEGYHLKDLQDCLDRLGPNGQTSIPSDSNPDHKRMVYETCLVSIGVPKESQSTTESDRYFRRLKKNYKLVLDKGIRITNIMAPYSSLLFIYNDSNKMKVWEEGLKYALDGRQKLDLIDLQKSLGSIDNGTYCYDLIHLNAKGKEIFTQKLIEALNY